MTGSSDRTPAARELAPFADAIARLIRAGRTDWSWRRARMVARDIGVGFKDDVVYELPDGSEVRPPRSLQLHQVLDRSQQRYRAHGSRAFVVTCVLTPTRVESFVVDTQSDPWPGGWPDPDDLAVIAHGLAAPPPWLQARLQQLRPADPKPPTLAALWAAQAQLLLDDLGGGWEPRGKGAGLTLVRRRTPWLLDLVTLNRSRDPGTSGQVYVCVVDLLDGVGHLTLGRGISVYVPSLRSPDARRLIAGAALGPGLLLVESVQSAAEGAAALLRRLRGQP